MRLIHNLVFILFFGLFSCENEKPATQIKVFELDFHPREAKYVFAELTHVVDNASESTGYYSGLQPILPENNEVKQTHLLIFTSNLPAVDYSYTTSRFTPYQLQIAHLGADHQQLSPHNTALEATLETNFHERFVEKKNSPNYFAYIPHEYRTTGITNLTVTANQPLFGLPAGSILNDHFYIHFLDPQQIINYETNQLVVGYRSDLNKMSIAEWLEIKPMAQPFMELGFHSAPPEVPIEVKFTIQMTTLQGNLIESTTSEIHLIN